MAENKQIPAIRFAGFTEAWGQCKLEDIGQSESGTSIETEFNPHGQYKVISIGSYSENSTYNEQGIRAIHSNKTEKRVLNKDDLTMILNDKTQAGRIIGRVLLIEESAKYVYNQRTQRITPNKDLYNSTFLYHFFNAPLVRDKIIKQSQGNTQIYVNWSTIKDTTYYIPNKVEQEKISVLFKKITDMITLHQCKYDKLLNIKKVLLEKMFPQNGSDVPEIRFKGFTAPWKQRKLGDLGEFRSNGVDKLSNPNEYPVNLLNYMDVYNRRKITNDNAKYLMQVTAKYNQLKDNNILKGDVFFTPTSETADDIGHVMVIEENLENTVYSYHLMRYRPKQNVFYLTFPNYCLDVDSIKKQMALAAQGVQRFVVNRKQFEELKTIIPCLSEQEKISKTLIFLDNLITLYQRKCEKLKNIKKSLLEKMFI